MMMDAFSQPKRAALWGSPASEPFAGTTSWPKPLAGTLSNNNFPNRRAEIDFQSLLARHNQPPRIQPQLVQHCGVDIGYIMAFLHGVETQFIGCAVHYAALDPAACHPDFAYRGCTPRTRSPAVGIEFAADSSPW